MNLRHIVGNGAEGRHRAEGNTLVVHIEAGDDKPELAEELEAWYRPALIDEAKKTETELLTVRKVRRRIFSPMLDKNGVCKRHAVTSKDAPTACRRMVSGSVALPSAGFFSPFPHGTGTLSVSY